MQGALLRALAGQVPANGFPGTPVQLEAQGALFRMRRRGEVIVVESMAAWLHGEPKPKREPKD